MSVSTATTTGSEQWVSGPFGDSRFKYFLVAPALFIMFAIALFPLINLLVVSFQGISIIAENKSLQGVANYERLAGDVRMWKSLLHTIGLLLVALPIELILGMAMALLFVEKMRGRQIFVALLVLPMVIAPIVAGATWRLMFDDQFGPINQIIGWFAGRDVTIVWLADSSFVWPAILATEIWHSTPFMFIILLAGLAGVDRSQIESAQIDGASPVRIFFKIVVPAIRPVLAVAILIRALDLFRIFDIIWALTRGGPGTVTETISTFTFVKAFEQFDTSFAAAVAITVVLILTAVTVFALRRIEVAR